MSDIILTNHTGNSMTVVSNLFIDTYMPEANGDYVKVYLYLLRCASAGQSITVAFLALQLNYSEALIKKSLTYWEEEGLLSLTLNQNKQILSIQLLPVLEKIIPPAEEEFTAAKETYPDAAPQKINYQPDELSGKIQGEKLSQIIFVAETYLMKNLTSTDLNTIYYICDTLKFSPDLMEYLIEYCIGMNKKSMRYIETVAISWYESGIDTVKKAKESTAAYNKNYFSIMKAFGISGRNPGQIESDYIKKWFETFCFPLNIILEACNRTLTATGKPSFPYADSILTGWFNEKIHTLDDIKALDAKHKENKNTTQAAPKKAAPAPNKFHNFQQRSYDYAELEQRFIKKANDIQKESR